MFVVVVVDVVVVDVVVVDVVDVCYCFYCLFSSSQLVFAGFVISVVVVVVVVVVCYCFCFVCYCYYFLHHNASAGFSISVVVVVVVVVIVFVFVLFLFCYYLLFSSSQFVFAGFDISVSFLLDELHKVHLPAPAVVVFHELALEEVLDGGVAADGELGTEQMYVG